MFRKKPDPFAELRILRATGLTAAEQCLQVGDRDGAKQRLENLALLGMQDVDDCRRIAKIYWELGLQSMAGRFWYVCDDSGPEIESACREFERSCGDNLLVISQSLPRLASRDDSQRVQQLRERIVLPAIFKQSRVSKLLGPLSFFGCALAFVLGVIIFFIGLAVIIDEFAR